MHDFQEIIEYKLHPKKTSSTPKPKRDKGDRKAKREERKHNSEGNIPDEELLPENYDNNLIPGHYIVIIKCRHSGIARTIEYDDNVNVKN